MLRPVVDPQEPDTEGWLLHLSTKAAQPVRDPALTLGALGDFTLQEGLVSSLTALSLGPAGSMVYFVLSSLPSRKTKPKNQNQSQSTSQRELGIATPAIPDLETQWQRGIGAP